LEIIHIDQPQHRQHDQLFTQGGRPPDEVNQFLHEQDDVDALRNDQPQVQGELQPAGAEDEFGQRCHYRGRCIGHELFQVEKRDEFIE